MVSTYVDRAILLRILGFLASSAFLLHKVRDFHPAAICGLLGLLTLGFAGLAIYDRMRQTTLVIWCTAAGIFGYVVVLSLANDDLGNPWIGLFRYGIGIAMIFVFSGCWLTGENYRALLGLLSAYTMVCALTLAYQWIAGPVSWFAESSERAGMARYASLAGSLTAYGAMVAPGLFIALRQRTLWGWGLRAAIILGAVLSLQKAAILGVVLAFATDYLFKKKKLSLRVLGWGCAAVAVMVVAAYFLINTENPLGNFLRGAVGALDEAERSDVTIIQSIYDRTIELPKESFGYHASANLWLGVGVFGAGGATGYNDIPMPHNLFVEIILTHGFLLGTILCLGLIGLAVRSVLIAFDTNASEPMQAAAGVYLTVLASTVGSGSVYFHPAVGCFFWSALLMLVQGRGSDQRRQLS